MSSDELSERPLTVLLERWRGGDDSALEELIALVHPELRRIAAVHMRKERADHTLQPTALVNEAYARLVGLELSWRDRVHFLSMASRVMRRVLVDHARAAGARKRGRSVVRVTLDEAAAPVEPALEVLELDRALEELGSQEERPARAVELHYYGGLSYREIAEALGVSEATVERDLRFARAWLRREMEHDPSGDA